MSAKGEELLKRVKVSRTLFRAYFTLNVIIHVVFWRPVFFS